MTTEEALRVIYAAQGWDFWQEGDRLCVSNPEGLVVYPSDVPQPTEDTTEGLTEFARLLLWAFSQGFSITQMETCITALCHEDIHPYIWVGKGTTPQEAFVLALAAAIQARKE